MFLLSTYTLPAFNLSVLSTRAYRIIIIKYLHVRGVELKLLRWLQERRWPLDGHVLNDGRGRMPVQAHVFVKRIIRCDLML